MGRLDLRYLLAGLGVALLMALVVGQHRGTESKRLSQAMPVSTQAFTSLNTAATDAQTNAANDVRGLVETVFDRFHPHIPSGHSIRERVLRNEIAFRGRAYPSIVESAVADAANAAVDVHGLTEWMKTSVVQLHLFRTALRPYVPALIGAAPNDTLSEEMSPAEAAFVILYLYQGKLREPEYQVTPDVWVQWWTKRAEEQSIGRSHVRLIAHDRSERAMASLEAQFSREEAVLSRSVHRFLDDAGFQE